MKFRYSISLCFVLFLNLSISAQTVFQSGSSYQLLKGSNAQSLAPTWMDPGFDDASWTTALAPFRYGDGTGGTELTDMQGGYSTIFLRSSFNLTDAHLVEQLSCIYDWDDGFVLWINGVQVHSENAPASITYDAVATTWNEMGDIDTVNVTDVTSLNLQEGSNTIAVFACNTDISTSSDFYFDMNISVVKGQEAIDPETIDLSDTVGLGFSLPSGFYTGTPSLTMSTGYAGASIIYTLDGSNPISSTSAITAGTSATITIDPGMKSYSGTWRRGETPAFTVRACIKVGEEYSNPRSRTYIFIEEVKAQTSPGHIWPSSDEVNDQSIDYDMADDIITDRIYQNLIDDALLEVPSISLMTDNDNLFGSDSGIYVNAEEKGDLWERECAIELINPDGSEGFNVNAGVRIRGKASRTGNNPKHSLRLFFRSEYGDSKLEYPLFEDEGVDKFDKIDLRTAQNYSWNFADGTNYTMVREVFARDAQGETGQPYTRSRYYHLYLNGMYWGLYQTQERSEAKFSADYLGGESDDYDVVKISGVDPDPYAIAATDGTLDKWNEVYNMTQTGFTSNASYFALEGKDANGEPDGSEVYVDIDNLIDYMINIFYTGNYDAPITKWGNNNLPNNMYAVTNRNNRTHGFKFYVHDAEHGMRLLEDNQWNPGIGLHENRVNIGNLDSDDELKMVVDNFEYFHPQWLHHQLAKNSEYKVRFANRAYDQLTGDGVFTTDRNTERFTTRMAMIDTAVIAESARWGDVVSWLDESRNQDDWQTECNNVLNNYIPYRTDILIDQLKDVGLFPNMDAPVIKSTSNLEFSPIENINSSLNIKITATEGQIYYTTDGSDPREVNGTLSAIATAHNQANTITISASQHIRARTFSGGNWSALTEVKFLKEETDFSNLMVTEVHYHPLDVIEGTDTTSGKSYEFIEFKNTSTTTALNLNGLSIDDGVEYTFPSNYILQPQEYFVVAAKPSKFYNHYGVMASGNFEKSLSNSGEQVLINHESLGAIINFAYADSLPWPEAADGTGPSLSANAINPTGDPNLYDYWAASSVTGGTPFDGEDINNEATLTTENKTLSLVYPNPTEDLVFIKSLSNSAPEFDLELFSINGQLLYQSSHYELATISLASLGVPYGIYTLRIQSDDKVETQKIVYRP